MGIKREAGNGFNMFFMRIPRRVGIEGGREGTEPKSKRVRRQRLKSELHGEPKESDLPLVLPGWRLRRRKVEKTAQMGQRGRLRSLPAPPFLNYEGK